MTKQHFESLFYPKSIAIIGAGRKEKTVGNDVLKNLIQQGYKGEIYPVNRKADELHGKKVYKTIDEIPGNVDLAIVAIPAKYVPAVIEEIAQKKQTKAAVVISAGFKEMGNKDLEEQLKNSCTNNDVMLIGPNCLGVINSEINMNASFASLMPENGNIAFMSQSGALCTAILDYANDLGLGFSKFISMGNKAQTKELDMIRYFFEDEKTKVIAMYIEDLINAPEIIKTIKSFNQGDNPKPIIAIKSGSTEEGASAVASHTGSLAGGDNAYNALFKQTGIIRARSISEMFILAQIFSDNKLTEIDEVAIVTNAGGPGVLTTDALISNGFKLAKLSEKTIEALKAILPPAAACHNPVDVLGDARAERYHETLKILCQDEIADAFLLLLTPQSMTEIPETAHAIVDVMKCCKKPIIVSFMGRPSVKAGVEILRKENITTSEFPEPAAAAMAAFGKFARFTKNEKEEPKSFSDANSEEVSRLFSEAKNKNQTSFPEAEAIKIFEAYNFPTLKSKLATSAEEAERVAREFNCKLAMKIVSPNILHKSDVGGVFLNIDFKNAYKKYEEMMWLVQEKKPEAKLEGTLLMEMAPKNGTELILGVSKAPGLGTMIMLGLGGIYVEVLKDVSFGFTPLTKIDIKRMIKNLKTTEIFKGVRGQEPRDVDALINCVARLSQMVVEHPEIKELDINPLLVLPKEQGVIVLDGRIVIE